MKFNILFIAFAILFSNCNIFQNEKSGTLNKPQLYSPNTGSENINPAGITLSWSSVNSTSTYSVKYDLQYYCKGSSTITISDLNFNSSYISQLKHGSKYFWKVKAKNNVSQSEWSSESNFITSMGKPKLQDPSNNTTLTHAGVHLIWSWVEGANMYELQYSNNNTFQNAITVKTLIPSQSNITLNHKLKYFWRVRAIGNDVTSQWSDTWSFNTP